jgi:hypothetical protein
LIRFIEKESSMDEGERGLFGKLAQQAAPARDLGLARYVEAERTAIVYDRFEFDALIEADHPARSIWGYLEKADLSALYARIRARARGWAARASLSA